MLWLMRVSLFDSLSTQKFSLTITTRLLYVLCRWTIGRRNDAWQPLILSFIRYLHLLTSQYCQAMVCRLQGSSLRLVDWLLRVVSPFPGRIDPEFSGTTFISRYCEIITISIVPLCTGSGSLRRILPIGHLNQDILHNIVFCRPIGLF
jgi:hypothetical protein